MKLKPLLMFFLLFPIFFACQKDDDQAEPNPCKSVNCKNGGTCVNGTCDCPEGYEGAECGKEETPSSMTIEKIDLVSFPSTTTDGQDWDYASANPDIYIEIEQNNSILLTTNYYDESDPNSNYSYLKENSKSVDLGDPTTSYVISMYDYDSSSGDDLMSSISFAPYQEGQDFPETISISAGGFTKYQLQLSYNF